MAHAKVRAFPFPFFRTCLALLLLSTSLDIRSTLPSAIVRSLYYYCTLKSQGPNAAPNLGQGQPFFCNVACTSYGISGISAMELLSCPSSTHMLLSARTLSNDARRHSARLKCLTLHARFAGSRCQRSVACGKPTTCWSSVGRSMPAVVFFAPLSLPAAAASMPASPLLPIALLKASASCRPFILFSRNGSLACVLDHVISFLLPSLAFGGLGVPSCGRESSSSMHVLPSPPLGRLIAHVQTNTSPSALLLVYISFVICQSRNVAAVPVVFPVPIGLRCTGCPFL